MLCDSHSVFDVLLFAEREREREREREEESLFLSNNARMCVMRIIAFRFSSSRKMRNLVSRKGHREADVVF